MHFFHIYYIHQQSNAKKKHLNTFCFNFLRYHFLSYNHHLMNIITHHYLMIYFLLKMIVVQIANNCLIFYSLVYFENFINFINFHWYLKNDWNYFLYYLHSYLFIGIMQIKYQQKACFKLFIPFMFVYRITVNNLNNLYWLIYFDNHLHFHYYYYCYLNPLLFLSMSFFIIKSSLFLILLNHHLIFVKCN